MTVLSSDDKAPRGDVVAGRTPAEPLILARPACDSCSWVIIPGQGWRLKILHGACRVHDQLPAVPWSYRAWSAAEAARQDEASRASRLAAEALRTPARD